YRQADEWTLARAEVKLTGTVVRARLFAAASHHAVFRINGVPCLETSSFGYPGEGYYDAADVTPLMRSAGATADGSAATATLTGLVHWYGPGQGRAACVPGLLAQLHVDYSDGRREVFGTGPSWRVAEGPYRQSGYRNDEGDPVEHLDATAGTPRWEAATSIGMHPVADFPAVHPRRTFLAKETVDAAQLLTAADGTVVADFGRVIPGRPMVDFGTGVHGRTVMIRAGYNLRADGRVDTGKSASQNTDMSFPYTQVNGPQRYEAGVHLGFQYLEMPEVEAAELVKVSAVVVHAGHPAEGSFHSSDPALDAVFALLRDSARLGVQEQFVDTPTREKGQFLGDAVNISYATMALFGERNYTAQALREFAASATRYWHTGEDRGHFNAVYPNGDGKRDIPDFSLMMPEWVEEYHRFSGDTALVQELVPCLRATADYVLRHIPDTGPTACLVTELGGGSGPYLHGIVDWPAPGRFGYDMDCAAKTTVNAQAASALGAVSRLCLLAGDSPAARHYGDHAAALTAAINSLLRVGGVFVDGLHADGRPSHHASQHATSFPLSLGLTAAGEAAADAQRLAAMGMRQGPMTVHRLVRALLAAGLVDDVLELLTNAGQPGWARILAAGGTFTWEAWELEPGTDYSQSHAWSASVIREILEHLLGIRVVAAGGASLVIAPPVCRLEHASGEVPLQGGMATASWRRRGSLMELDCSVPAGVAATVLLPTGSYRVEGPTPAGPNAVEGPDGRGCVGAVHQVAYRIHPGSWSFRPA
ncbi:MAG: family 78 glycoside hydrolase catalytic domain, partial [Arthrobacter sp.]